MLRARIGTLVAASSAVAFLIFARGKDPAPLSVISIVSVDAAGNATSLGVARAHLAAGDAADLAPAMAHSDIPPVDPSP